MNPIGYHGLVAYSSKKATTGLWRAAKTAERHAEVCVADRPIGPVGIVLQGEMTALFESDCWSVVDADGTRHATRDYVSRLDTPADHHEYVVAAKTALGWAEWGDGRSYTEGFMRGHLIRAVWVKKWATEYHSPARHIAAVLGVAVIYIHDGLERIWERFPSDDTAEARFDDYIDLEEKAS